MLLIYTIWLPEACQRRSLSGGEGLRRPKAYAEGVGGQREGGREGKAGEGERRERDEHRGEYRQHRRIYTRWLEARGLPSRRAKLCLCLSLTQTLSHTQKGGETETGAHTAKPTTRSAVERRASIYSQRCPPRSIPTVTLLFIIIVCSSPVHVRNFYIPAFFIKYDMCIRFSNMVGFNLTAATVTIHCLKLCCFIMQFDTVIGYMRKKPQHGVKRVCKFLKWSVSF